MTGATKLFQISWKNYMEGTQPLYKETGYVELRETNIKCPKCGRKIIKDVSTVRPHYFCLSCGWGRIL